MSDDWKWVLRSAPATRPVLRYLDIDADADAAQNAAPGTQAKAAASTIGHATVFSDTRGLLNVSAGDGSMNAGVSTQADLGATFALATSLYGNSLVQFSGNFGYGAANGSPATAFRTSYSREIGGRHARSFADHAAIDAAGTRCGRVRRSGRRGARVAADHVGRVLRTRIRSPITSRCSMVSRWTWFVPGPPELLQPLCAPDLRGG